ncbi:MAG: hypothetical protein A3G92_07305 [Deltaproteobacteria bacterium RIFCSPLOWO2_12_FULL_38_8]|nr:MAG: hypothetical protein A3G92_07305 [Deltaproteobacteria bacterium RIFCSPLOWO2_12_FULL_38_8]
MKFKKFLCLGVFVVSLIPVCTLAKSYTVSAKLEEGTFMLPHYSVTGTNLAYDRGVAYAVIHTQGDCQTYAVPRCRSSHSPYPDPYPGHPGYWQECWV